jgi:hypothetical protein
MTSFVELKKSIVFLVTTFVLACFGLLPQAQAISPAPDGCYPGFTTAEGCQALQNLSTGSGNTGVGWRSLFLVADGSFSTGVGAGALLSNNGNNNTAVGAAALLLNTTGASNTAVGTAALENDIVGPFNTAVGLQALQNATAYANAAFGDLSLANLTTGHFNTAIGAAAGQNQTTGHNNVYIGQGSAGVAGENNTCYIQGIAGSSIPTANASIVFVDTASGKLATVLTDANGNRLTLPISPSQLQAAPVGQPKAVPERYFEDGHQAMLNLKVEKLQETVAQQQKQIESLTTQLREQADTFTAQLKEQAAQIQKVSAQLELNKPAPRTAQNND